MILVVDGITAPLNAVTTYMYPTERRYRGSAFAWGLGTIIFAGLSPLISKGSVIITNNEVSPVFWLIFCSLCMIIAVKYAPDVRLGKQHSSLPSFLSERKTFNNIKTETI